MTTPTLQTIASTLRNTTNDIRSADIEDGIHAGDTLRIEFENGRIFYAVYDEDEPSTLMWAEYYYDENDVEEVLNEGGERDMSDGDVAALYYALKANNHGGTRQGCPPHPMKGKHHAHHRHFAGTGHGRVARPAHRQNHRHEGRSVEHGTLRAEGRGED